MAKISVQLYSVKDYTGKDMVSALEQIAKAGYEGVEFAGYGGLGAEDMNHHLDRVGLVASGSHVSIQLLREALQDVIAYNKTIQNPYIICPGAPAVAREEYEALHREFLAIGEKIHKAGMKFGYHNHHKEFVSFDGRYGMDILLDGGNLVYEVDTYWTEYAGIDTLAYLKKIGKKCELVHLKDMVVDQNKNKSSCTYGEGILNNRGIIDTALVHCDPAWFVIEWEAFNTMDSMEAVTKSCKNLKALLGR